MHKAMEKFYSLFMSLKLVFGEPRRNGVCFRLSSGAIRASLLLSPLVRKVIEKKLRPCHECPQHLIFQAKGLKARESGKGSKGFKSAGQWTKCRKKTFCMPFEGKVGVSQPAINGIEVELRQESSH